MSVYVLPNKMATADHDEYMRTWTELAQPILDAAPGSTLARYGHNHSSYQIEIQFDDKIMPMTVEFTQALSAALTNEGGSEGSEGTEPDGFDPEDDDDVLF